MTWPSSSAWDSPAAPTAARCCRRCPHEDSFAHRLEIEVAAKERIAEAALGLVPAGASVYVDSSSTSYVVARRLLREKPPLTARALDIADAVLTGCALAVRDRHDRA